MLDRLELRGGGDLGRESVPGGASLIEEGRYAYEPRGVGSPVEEGPVEDREELCVGGAAGQELLRVEEREDCRDDRTELRDLSMKPFRPVGSGCRFSTCSKRRLPKS